METAGGPETAGRSIVREGFRKGAFGGEQGTEWTLAQSGAIVHAWASSVEVD
jgi:hypothetical protein